MDKNIYKALHSNEYPQIIFALKSPLRAMLKENEQVPVKGELTIAGFTHTILMNIDLLMPQDEVLFVTGSQVIHLSDYGIILTKVLLGTVETGNDIAITYKLLFALQTNH